MSLPRQWWAPPLQPKDGPGTNINGSLCHHRLHHTGHAFAEKTKRWPSFSCQGPQGRGCLREPRQHNGDGRRRFPLSESSAVRLHTAAVRGSGPHWEAVRMLQTGAKSAAFSQHRCHERCVQALPIGVASAAQAETWDSTEAAAEAQTATAAGQLEQPRVVAHGAALGLVPSEQLAASTPPARRAAAISRRAASPGKDSARVCPHPALRSMGWSLLQVQAQPTDAAKPQLPYPQTGRSGTMGPRISRARLLRLVLPRYGTATKSSSNSQQHRRKLQHAAVDHAMVHPARSTNEKQGGVKTIAWTTWKSRQVLWAPCTSVPLTSGTQSNRFSWLTDPWFCWCYTTPSCSCLMMAFKPGGNGLKSSNVTSWNYNTNTKPTNQVTAKE